VVGWRIPMSTFEFMGGIARGVMGGR
jgi:hypothetical protein